MRIDESTVADLVEARTRRPAAVAEAAARRIRRPLVGEAGTLFLVAADHPARGALRVGDDVNAMEDRRRLLERVVTALSRPGVDGVLATADLVEDLLLLGLLDDKLVVGSMNRGGLAGSSFELDDRFTGYTPAGIRAFGLDGGKMLLKIADDDPGTGATLERCARAIDELASAGLLALVEPFAAYLDPDGRAVVDLDPARTARAVAIASGLGSTSAYTWLKAPVTEHPERVLAASTLPTVILGGDVDTSRPAVAERWARSLALPNVRGVVAGRALLYPADGDVAAAVDAAVALVARHTARTSDGTARSA